MPQRLVYFNGNFVPEREARISIFDSALMFGDMVFEMTRSFKQKPYRLRNHLKRLYASMKYAEIDCGLSIDQMEDATHKTIKKNLPALENLDFQIMHNVTRGALGFYDILRGVSRQVCMDLAAKLNIPVYETDIEPYDVREADEAWYTSTTICMVPITRFNFQPVGTGKPGPIYQQLLAAWSEEVGVDIPAQARDYAERAKTWTP